MATRHGSEHLGLAKVWNTLGFADKQCFVGAKAVDMASTAEAADCIGYKCVSSILGSTTDAQLVSTRHVRYVMTRSDNPRSLSPCKQLPCAILLKQSISPVLLKEM